MENENEEKKKLIKYEEIINLSPFDLTTRFSKLTYIITIKLRFISLDDGYTHFTCGSYNFSMRIIVR